MHMGILATGYEFLRSSCVFIGIEARIRSKTAQSKRLSESLKALQLLGCGDETCLFLSFNYLKHYNVFFKFIPSFFSKSVGFGIVRIGFEL